MINIIMIVKLSNSTQDIPHIASLYEAQPPKFLCLGAEFSGIVYPLFTAKKTLGYHS